MSPTGPPPTTALNAHDAARTINTNDPIKAIERRRFDATASNMMDPQRRGDQNFTLTGPRSASSVWKYSRGANLNCLAKMFDGKLWILVL